MVKRVMTPAINGMTVKEERACLSEIRQLSASVQYKSVLSNGWTAGDFALKYVTGHYRKRKIKENTTDGDGCPQVDEETDDLQAAVNGVVHDSEAVGNYLADPFAGRPQSVKDALLKQTKRTQRYRSTAKSRILGMTVGDIRYCFQQLRNAGDCLGPEVVLYNGQCAGEFALCYLIETSNSMRNRRKQKIRKLDGEDTHCSENDNHPRSQIQSKPTKCIGYGNLMTFS